MVETRTRRLGRALEGRTERLSLAAQREQQRRRFEGQIGKEHGWMATFGLVHGGFHGAWCWDRLIPELEVRGHRAVAMDLPLDDPDATLLEYTTSVVEALEGIDEPVILVGHSLGGQVIPHVPSRRAVSRLVFLAAMFDAAALPPAPPGVELPDVPMTIIDMSVLVPRGPMTEITPEGAAAMFFGRCTADDTAWAVSRIRPQGRAAARRFDEPWPDVPSSLIVTTDDKAHNSDYDRLVAGPRLGVEPIEIEGDHAPFLSCPGRFAEVLSELAGDA